MDAYEDHSIEQESVEVIEIATADPTAGEREAVDDGRKWLEALLDGIIQVEQVTT